MRQICIIHGGTIYDSDAEFLQHLNELDISYDRLLYRPRWNNWLGETLTNFEVLLPSMPNNANAKYSEWETYFSKIVPLLRADAILIGHSLGGIFLAKYLSEHADSLHFAKVVFISAPYDDEASESLGSFRLSNEIKNLPNTATDFYIFHSHDDVVVPVAEAAKYAHLLPEAVVTLFDDRGHINTPTFPELIEVIKK